MTNTAFQVAHADVCIKCNTVIGEGEMARYGSYGLIQHVRCPKGKPCGTCHLQHAGDCY